MSLTEAVRMTYWATAGNQQIIAIIIFRDVQKRIAQISCVYQKDIYVYQFGAVVLASSLPMEAWSFHTYLAGFLHTRYSSKLFSFKGCKPDDLVGLTPSKEDP